MNERALKCPNAKVNLVQKGFTYQQLTQVCFSLIILSSLSQCTYFCSDISNLEIVLD